MKNITTLLATSLMMISTATVAGDKVISSTDGKSMFNAEVELGGIYTNVADFDGEGFRVSGLINFPITIENAEVYGRASYQTSQGTVNGLKQNLNESELVIGAAFHLNEQLAVYVESGDLKQSFETAVAQAPREFIDVYRLGGIKTIKNLKFDLSLEHRNGAQSDLGYRATLKTMNDSFSLHYTNVGEYQSFGFSFLHKF